MTNATKLLRCVIVLVLFSGGTASHIVRAQDATFSPTFHGVLQTELGAAIEAVGDYVRTNPDAPDVEAARRWVLETALEHGLESTALDAAQLAIESETASQPVRALAIQVQGIGLAKAGRLDEALPVFETHLKSARIRNPTPTVDFGLALVGEAQLANNPEAAREILERLKDALFLNASVRQLCEDRLLKLQLLGRKAPAVTATDLAGDPLDLSQFSGKVLLIDFWATNCPPCLEEFPAMKRVYEEHHADGFETIGITLDEQQSVVDEFQEKWALPWLLALNGSDKGQTRDRFRVRTIPSLFLLNRSGEIAYVDVRGDTLRRGVERLLNEE